MNTKDLRWLSRRELVDIIYRLQTENEAQKKQLEAQTEELKKRAEIGKNAGSIAEASLALSGVFEAAQKAADQYLLSIKALESEARKKADRNPAAGDGPKEDPAGDTQ